MRSPAAFSHTAALGALSVATLAPSSAFAVDYLTAEQAARLIFPSAERFETQRLSLSAEQMAELDKLGVQARSAQWTLQAALQGNTLLGWVIADEVLGKFELISYAVGLGVDGAVKQVEILSYRESHGHEIRLPAWRRQFVGKTAASPLRSGEDIAQISGATLSCSHVTQGVRRIVQVVAQARRLGTLK
jgi:Na+-translocating ferredoxin:NAD+ oxidoreductase RnfG subunit